MLCRADRVRPLPEEMTFEQGAGLNVAYVTAFRALIDVAKVTSQATVLVHGGTGGVGYAAVEIALGHKLAVFATAGSDAGAEMLLDRGLPAERVLRHDEPDYLNGLPDEGVDVILEMAAHQNLTSDLEHLKPNGRVVVVGNRGPTTIDARLLMGGQTSIRGMSYWSGGEAAVSRALDAVTVGCEQGDLRPIVQQTFPLEQTREAWQTVMRGGSRGKVLLIP